MTKLNVFPVHAESVYEEGATASVAGVTTGMSSVPSMLRSVAVVWRPVASRIGKVSGSTHEPLVMARKKPPLVFTTELTRVMLLGNVDVMRYGGVPPKM